MDIRLAVYSVFMPTQLYWQKQQKVKRHFASGLASFGHGEI
jgi:hypothetical protein